MKLRPLHDRVVIRRSEEEKKTAYSGSNTVKVDGEDLLVMAENEILAVIEG